MNYLMIWWYFVEARVYSHTFLYLCFFVPRMLENLLKRYSFCGVDCQHARNQILSFFWNPDRKFKFTRKYFVVKFLNFCITEGQVPCQHWKKYNSDTPNINFQRIIFIISFDHLRSSIARRPALSSQHLI